MILGDSLQVMAASPSARALRGKVQMIYIDPPYGIKFGSNWQVSARKRDVKDGKLEDAAARPSRSRPSATRGSWASTRTSRTCATGSSSRETCSPSPARASSRSATRTSTCAVADGRGIRRENFVSQIVYKTTTGAGSFAGGTDVLASVADHILWFARDIAAIKYRQLFGVKDAGGAGASGYTRIETVDGNAEPPPPRSWPTPLELESSPRTTWSRKPPASDRQRYSRSTLKARRTCLGKAGGKRIGMVWTASHLHSDLSPRATLCGRRPLP